MVLLKCQWPCPESDTRTNELHPLPHMYIWNGGGCQCAWILHGIVGLTLEQWLTDYQEGVLQGKVGWSSVLWTSLVARWLSHLSWPCTQPQLRRVLQWAVSWVTRPQLPPLWGKHILRWIFNQWVKIPNLHQSSQRHVHWHIHWGHHMLYLNLLFPVSSGVFFWWHANAPGMVLMQTGSRLVLQRLYQVLSP